MHWTLRDWQGGLRLQRDCPERLLILRNVLPENVPERLGLLRAEIYSLGILNGHRFRRFLMYKAKNKQEVPHADAHLHAV